MQKVTATINLRAIQNNAKAFKSLTKTRLYAVVKANAYGHGAEEVTAALVGVADGFAVALIDEAICIRAAACGNEILVFTPPMDREEAAILAINGFTATVPDLWTAKLLASVCEQLRLPIKAHLKMNTGMNRYGMHFSALGRVCAFLRQHPLVQVDGVYSHLYACDKSVAEAQRAEFEKGVRLVKGYYPAAKAHLSATYGALLGKSFTFDGVRVGIGLYGYFPDGLSDSERRVADGLCLQGAMTLSTRVVVSRKATRGGAGYGAACISKPQSLSVLRVGYADGFLRSKNNGLLRETDSSLALCMDACIVNGKLRRGRELTLLSNAQQTAAAANTIAYEVLCAATRRAEFVYAYE